MADKEVYTVQHRVHSVIPYPAHCRGALYPSNDWQGFGELEVFKKPTKRASIKCDWSPLNFEILSWKGQSQDSGLRNYYLELNSPPPSQNVFLETFLAKTSLKEFAYRDRKQLVLHQNIQKLFCSIHDKISVLKRKFPKENSIFLSMTHESITFTPDFSVRMASTKEKLFEDENLVIISSKDAINMKEWRDHLIKNWDKV